MEPCIYDLHNTLNIVICSFHDNNGTALLVDNTDITLAGNTEFTHNRACGSIALGGAIIAVSSNLTFTGNKTFLGNNVITGQCPLFDSNVGGGGAIYTFNTVLRFSGTNNFINNFLYWQHSSFSHMQRSSAQ